MTEPTISNRGFKHMDPVRNRNGGEVRVFESSNAILPCIWLSVTWMDMAEGSAELTLVDAEKLRDQLTYLIENHYQIVQAEVVDDLDDIRAGLDHAAIPPGARTDIEDLFRRILTQEQTIVRLTRTVAAVKALPEHFLQVRDNPPRLDPACAHIRAGAWEEAARRIRNVIQATEGK
jgi:hypothetical protein